MEPRDFCNFEGPFIILLSITNSTHTHDTANISTLSDKGVRCGLVILAGRFLFLLGTALLVTTALFSGWVAVVYPGFVQGCWGGAGVKFFMAPF